MTVARLFLEITFVHFNANYTIIQEKNRLVVVLNISHKNAAISFVFRGNKLTFMLSAWGLCGRKGTRNMVHPVT